MKSIWSESARTHCHETLKSDIHTDVLVIGGGMAGVLCAFFLKANGIDAVIAEGSKIGSGITKNTTAKITSQHGLIYHQLVKKSGLEKAGMYSIFYRHSSK